MSTETNESKLIRAALAAVTSEGTNTNEQAIQNLKAEVDKADPETVKRVLNEVTLEEAVNTGKTLYSAGKTLYEFAKKMGWVK